MSTYDRVPDYSTVTGRITGNASFIIQMLDMVDMEKLDSDTLRYLKMIRECANSITKINEDSWKAYRELNFGVTA